MVDDRRRQFPRLLGVPLPVLQVEGGAGDGTTSGLRAAIATPAFELVGCAARESAVPAYMDRLHAMTGVTEVGFSRSERLEKSGQRAVGTASSDGDCRGNDLKAARFAIVTYFNSSPAVAAAAGAAAAPGPLPTPAGTPPSRSASKTAAGDAQAPAASQTAAAKTGVTP